ncbi:MAG: iron-sulfur cluster assembly protein [Anaerolineales bacterium]|nr:iron-sulfur cluster assembly protein [Anaerolineales bacterium]
MSEPSLEETILERLRSVIDPETNVDVVRMRLVENLWADALGKVRYTFRPSSFVCPIAVSLAMDIKKAVADVPGVTSQEIAVEGYLAAAELETLINQEI